MDNFSINKTLNGSILCSMRFYVYSTLENPISELSFRLKWPEIETPVTFIGVKQKQPTYFDYALAGKGCGDRGPWGHPWGAWGRVQADCGALRDRPGKDEEQYPGIKTFEYHKERKELIIRFILT